MRNYSIGMRIGEYRVHLRMLPTLLFALPVPLLAALGVWQLDRAEYKRELVSTLSERQQLPPLLIGDQPVADKASIEYRPVRAIGEWEPEHRIFIENRKSGNQNGFHVVTPLRLENSPTRVLVNQGWVPAPTGGSLPDVPAPHGRVEVQGVAEIPAPPALVLHAKGAPPLDWGQRWPYLTVELFAAGASYPVQPFVILQNPREDQGFLRQWPRPEPHPEMHVGYAIQWFAFALIAFGLYLRFSVERVTPGDPQT